MYVWIYLYIYLYLYFVVHLLHLAVSGTMVPILGKFEEAIWAGGSAPVRPFRATRFKTGFLYANYVFKTNTRYLNLGIFL